MLFDRATIAGPARITRDGYFVADALVARANNIQTYTAGELGLTDRAATDKVRVFRPEGEVFHKDALASLAHRPITLDHPAEPVDSTNWKELGVGDVGGDVLRDGDFVRVPIKIMDAAAVDSVKTDRREFSLGYALKLDMTPGDHEGEAYDAVARDFRYNHLAAVRRARGGQELRIIDERNPSALDGINPEKTMKTITLDGLPVNLGDEAAVEAAIKKLTDRAAAAEDTLKDAKAEHDKALAAKDAEIDDLKGKVVDQAAIDALADAKADVVGKAKTVCGDKLGDTAGKTVAEVRRMACDAKGIVVADKSDDYIEARFDALTADLKATDSQVQNLGRPRVANDADQAVSDAYAEMVADLTNTKPAKAAAA